MNIASKGKLARLLASENISIQHRQVRTASFNLETRVLTLPQWKGLTEDGVDMLILHEVSHASNTPFNAWMVSMEQGTKDFGKRWNDYQQVCEDVRVNKLSNLRFPGGLPCYRQSAREFKTTDIFGVQGRNVDSLGFLDRLNLYFKGYGQFDSIAFTESELDIRARLLACMTFDESMAMAREIATLDSSGASTADPQEGEEGEGDGQSAPEDEEGESEQGDGSKDKSEDDAQEGEGDESDEDSDDDSEGKTETDGDGDTEDGEGSEGEDEGKGDEPGDESKDEPKQDASGEGAEGGEGAICDKPGEKAPSEEAPGASTMQAFEENMANKADCFTAETIYATLPADDAWDLKELVVPFDLIWKLIGDANKEDMPNWEQEATKKLSVFRKANRPAVATLVQEFEKRRQADQYSKSWEADSGQLNMNVIHSYKWNDDIFLQNTVTPDGTNHGLVMFIDWSGSMSSNINGSIDQVLNLIMFCDKAGIPFDVYAFSDVFGAGYTYDDKSLKHNGTRLNTRKMAVGDMYLRDTEFNFLQLATSQGGGRTFQKCLVALTAIKDAMRGGTKSIEIPWCMQLGGTPLSETVMGAIPVVNAFRAKYSIQKVHTVFLTDGAGCDPYYVKGANGKQEQFRDVILVDVKSRTEIEVKSNVADSLFSGMLGVFRARTGSTLTNFYVTGSDDAYYTQCAINDAQGNGRYASRRYEEETPELKLAMKDGGVLIENGSKGWDRHYVIVGGKALSRAGGKSEKLGKVKRGAGFGAIAKQMEEVAAAKRRNRVILQTFAGFIA